MRKRKMFSITRRYNFFFGVFFCLPISILFNKMLKWNATHDIPLRSIHTILHLTTGVNHGNEMKNF